MHCAQIAPVLIAERRVTDTWTTTGSITVLIAVANGAMRISISTPRPASGKEGERK